MPELNRKDFIQSLTLGGASLMASSTGLLAQTSVATGEPASRSIDLKNTQFELSLTMGKSLTAQVKHLPTGTLLADGPYSYSFGTPNFVLIAHDASSATLKGTTDTGLEVTHEFRAPATSPWIEEEITIRNTSTHPRSETFRCGFTLPVTSTTLPHYIFTAVPFRREPKNNERRYADYSLDQILHQKRFSNAREDSNPTRVYENYISEGWAATNGTTGFLFSKYNSMAREWSLLDRVIIPPDAIALRWGGAGVDPSDAEGFLVIPAGKTHSFGTSRLTFFSGDLTQGFYAFRAERASQGHGVPAGFNPPLHWNELYDNKLWWLHTDGGQDNPANRKKYYTLDDMKAEAAKAKAIGCEALYCDPGWDTNFASKIWDEDRLGKLTDFVALLKQDYGLKLSLHTPLSGWCNPRSYPPECFLVDSKGGKNLLCGASRQYVDETVRRLNILAEAGVTFFMFDGTMYQRECWSAEHGHGVPSTMAEHVDATNLIARRVHEKYPQVQIEMHDQAVGGTPTRYVPLYYGHGTDASGVSGFDTVWAFEMMWNPLADLFSGHSISLYYYNLAYGMPLYIHVDLRKDNEQALMFWWNASTCRHLGFGGTPENPKIRDAQSDAVKAYLRHKACFAAGTFYGIDEMTHVHRHPQKNMAVINCFNLDNGPITKEIRFKPSDNGLKADASYKFTGAETTLVDGSYILKLTVPARGNSLIEVTEA